MTLVPDDDAHGALPGPVASRDVEGLARWIAARTRSGETRIVGINGAQGSGKSTLAGRLRHALGKDHACAAVVLAIDDFYATRAQRSALADAVHPLLITRGVPGTHDVELMSATLERLRHLRAGHTLRLPHFVKAQDDRAPADRGVVVTGPVDVVLFEGWCVGTPPQAEAELLDPINRLEAEEDRDGRWRRYVNAQLAGPYARLFGSLDRLVFLQAPDFAVVHRWRLQQEAGNAAAAPRADHVMDAAALQRFIAHYERLTRHALHALPSHADVVFELDEQRRPLAVRYRGG
jgi:D-glycerate 3-kinase